MELITQEVPILSNRINDNKLVSSRISSLLLKTLLNQFFIRCPARYLRDLRS